MSPPLGGRRYSPVKDMSTDQMDKAVADLRAIYDSPEDEVREAIHATDGDLDAAGMILYGEPIEQHASASEEAAARGSVDVDKKAADEEFLGTITEEAQRSGVRKLLEIFPNYKASQIQQALRRRNYEFTEAAEDLADLSPSSSSPEPPRSRPTLKVRFTNRAGSNGAPPSSSSPSSSSGVPHLSNHESPSSESDLPIFTPRTTASVSPRTGSAALPLRYADWGFGELGRPKTPENKRADDQMAHDGDSSTPKTKREARVPPASRPSKPVHYIILDSDDADDVDMDSLLDRPVKKGASPATSHESGGEIDVDALLAGVTAADGDNAMIDSAQNPSNNILSKEPAPVGEGSLGSISWDDKVEHLMTVCPTAGRSMCAVELQLADGNVEEAFRELEGLGFGGEMCEESADEDDESEESDDDDEGESSVARGKRPASLKRRARPSKHGRPQKRRHRAGEETAAALGESREVKRTEEEDDDDEAEGLEPASQWVQSTIHADDGITIILDTGIHACKIPRKILRKLPDLKEAESIDDGSLKVPHVSQHTFDLALQWAVCKNGRLEKAQRKDKAAEVGAYVDLAVFASRVGLGLGSSQSPLLARLRAVLTSDRDALLGTHIRQAYTHLGEGDRVRKLLLQASVKPYAQFKHQDPADDDDDDSEDVSAEEALALNPAQRASYLKDRFRFGAEMRGIKAYRYDLMEEFQRVWWRRTSHQVRYSRTAHWCTRTELTDPLSNEQFFIS